MGSSSSSRGARTPSRSGPSPKRNDKAHSPHRLSTPTRAGLGSQRWSSARYDPLEPANHIGRASRPPAYMYRVKHVLIGLSDPSQEAKMGQEAHPDPTSPDPPTRPPSTKNSPGIKPRDSQHGHPPPPTSSNTSRTSPSSTPPSHAKTPDKPPPQPTTPPTPRKASRSKPTPYRVTKRSKAEKQPPPPPPPPRSEDKPEPATGTDTTHTLSRAVYSLESALARTPALASQNALLSKDLARARSSLKTADAALAELQATHALLVGDLARARAGMAALDRDKARLEALLEEERLGRARAEAGLEEKAGEAYVYRCAVAAVFKLPGTVREMAMMREVVGLVYERAMRRGARVAGVEAGGAGEGGGEGDAMSEHGDEDEEGDDGDDGSGDDAGDEDGSDEEPLAVVLARSRGGRGVQARAVMGLRA